MPNSREAPQTRVPSKCPNRWRYGERLAKEAFWLPASGGLNKDSIKAIMPAVAFHVWQSMSLHSWCRQGPHKPSSYDTFTSTLFGAELPQAKKKSYVYACRITSVTADSLQPCRLWPAKLLCQRGGSSGKNTGVYGPVLVAIHFYSTTFPAALTANSPEYLVLPEPL